MNIAIAKFLTKLTLFIQKNTECPNDKMLVTAVLHIVVGPINFGFINKNEQI